MLAKPPHGAPCNSCGLCCVRERCPIGELLYGPGDRCPALVMQFPRFTCGLIHNPAAFVPDLVAQHGAAAIKASVATIVGAGLGCDASFDGEPRNEVWIAWARRQVRRSDVQEAVSIWFPKQKESA